MFLNHPKFSIFLFFKIPCQFSILKLHNLMNDRSRVYVKEKTSPSNLRSFLPKLCLSNTD
ncbi:MAG: hypothetical protein CEN88_99 [Candidatus Berkelbacteria bacterium Licking1014_2]|uniref:Uncharacterized protein n=1 Tax=Candidatus Berkelbacteria bacterium Licking1014_2 TaxID=2017146 RepID=A0A554LWN8_9BACT|nr:MAG: hypothetical protein CEN88_99 [Candidatus Berkelbacteria bacterium Licking1014_2]